MQSTTLNQGEVAAFMLRLKSNGYKVFDFGTDGYSVEVDGLQVFRATNMGNERYQVRYHSGMFPDV